MAMFLSRLKQILNLGTKSITANGTYPASGDGYDGYSQVSVNMPSVTPSNRIPAALTSGNAVTPNDNGYAIESYDEITPSSDYEAVYTGDIVKFGGNGVISDSLPIDITPSNSQPALLRDTFPFKVTTNGFAVESIDDVAPSSTPTSVSTDDVVHIHGSGVIVDSIPTPTSITPSNSSPAPMTADTPVNPTANGYAIESYSSLTPSDSNPATILKGTIYKASASGQAVESVADLFPTSRAIEVTSDSVIRFAHTGYVTSYDPTPTSITPSNSTPVSLSSGTIYEPSASGYAISSYSSKTPSDSSPASVSSGAIIKASAAGYLYQSSGLGKYVNITNTASQDETFNLSAGSTTSISVAAKPKLILWFSGNYGSGVSAGYGEMGMYDGIRNKYRRVTYYSSGGNTSTDGGDITSVTSSTVSFKNKGSTYRRYHVMMWY